MKSPSNVVTGCRCGECDWQSNGDLLPDECPTCGSDDVMHAYADDVEMEQADRMIDEETEGEQQED